MSFKRWFDNGYGISYLPEFSNPDLWEVMVIKGTPEDWDFCDVLDGEPQRRGLTFEEFEILEDRVRAL